jgi:hypothetical protein
MKKFLFNWLIKDYIDEAVDKKFEEKAYERYFYGRQQNLRDRINQIRRTLGISSPQGVYVENSEEVQKPGSVLEVSDGKKYGLQARALESRVRQTEMENIKQKLMRGKK